MDVKESRPPTFTPDPEPDIQKVITDLKKFDIGVLSVKPDDVVVFRFDPDDRTFDDLDPKMAQALKRTLGVKGILFIPKGLDVEVVRKGEN